MDISWKFGSSKNFLLFKSYGLLKIMDAWVNTKQQNWVMCKLTISRHRMTSDDKVLSKLNATAKVPEIFRLLSVTQ